jgi:hypothetical protein
VQAVRSAPHEPIQVSLGSSSAAGSSTSTADVGLPSDASQRKLPRAAWREAVRLLLPAGDVMRGETAPYAHLSKSARCGPACVVRRSPSRDHDVSRASARRSPAAPASHQATQR